jgi:hypothetical protein
MDGQKSEKVTDRREIRGRQRKFIAFCMALLIGCIPTATVLAATYEVNKDTVNTLQGKTLEPNDIIRWSVPGGEVTGALQVVYLVNDIPENEGTTGDVNPGNSSDLTILNCTAKDFLKWEVVGASTKENVNGFVTFSAVFKQADDKKTDDKKTDDKKDEGKKDEGNKPSTVPEPNVPAVNPEAGKKSGEKKEDKEDREDRDNTPFINNPDALSAVYHDKTGKHAGAKFGKETQGPACDLGFQNKRPDGWKKGITFSMSVNDKHTFDLKNGTLDLYVPENLQKKGREYAIMGIDKEGNVIVFYDTDITNPYLVKADIELEGYAFELIYRDTAQT